MKKQLNKIAAMLLTGVVTVSVLPLSSFATTGIDEKTVTSRRTGQVTLYQDGALSDAYLEGDWSEQYTEPEEGTFEGDLYQGLKDFEEHISLAGYHLPEEEAQDRFQRLINSNPELFYVSNAVSYVPFDYCEDCDGFVYWYEGEEESYWMFITDFDPDSGRASLSSDSREHMETHNHYEAVYVWLPKYITDDKENLLEMTSEFEAAVENALAGIDKDEDMSDLDKALYFHDYLVKSNNYDYENFLKGDEFVPKESHSAYGALVKRVSVCDGYALAYSYLLQRCGIETRLVTSNEMAHAWSAVKLDGDWYFVDCTGDDRITGYTNADPGDRFDDVFHDSFLMSAELASNTQYDSGPYRGWAQTDIVADNTQYDEAIWRCEYLSNGDTDGDGSITAGDALLILKYVAEIDDPGFIEELANVDGEEDITASDALMILKYVAELIPELPSGPVIQKKGVTSEYSYCDGYWYYLDDVSLEIMKTSDPTQAGEVFSSIIRDAAGNWPVYDMEAGYFYTTSFGKASVYVPSKTMYVSDESTIYTIDLTDGAAEPWRTWTGEGYIYGLIVIDDNLYIGIANDANEKEALLPIFLGEN